MGRLFNTDQQSSNSGGGRIFGTGDVASLLSNIDETKSTFAKRQEAQARIAKTDAEVAQSQKDIFNPLKILGDIGNAANQFVGDVFTPAPVRNAQSEIRKNLSKGDIALAKAVASGKISQEEADKTRAMIAGFIDNRATTQGKSIVSSIQQGAGNLADLALQGGAVLNELGRSTNVWESEAQKNTGRIQSQQTTDFLRNKIKDAKTVTGDSLNPYQDYQPTDNIGQNILDVGGRSLMAGIDATALTGLGIGPAAKALLGAELRGVKAGMKVATKDVEDLVSFEGAPDKKQVAKYKAEIKAGKPQEPIKIIEDRNGKFGIEDGKHRFEAYKQLGISEVPIEVVTPKAKAVEATALKPSGSAQNLVNAVAEKTGVDLGDVAQYGSVSYKEEAAKALKLVETDPQAAKDIAMGRATADNPVQEVSIKNALIDKSVKDGDFATLQELANSPTQTRISEAAQTLGAEGYSSADVVNPVKNMQTIRDARVKAVSKRSGKSPAQLVQSTTEKISKSIPTVTKNDWEAFVKQLECK